jgi:hypothetical protein
VQAQNAVFVIGITTITITMIITMTMILFVPILATSTIPKTLTMTIRVLVYDIGGNPGNAYIGVRATTCICIGAWFIVG